MNIVPNFTVRLMTHADINRCWALWRQSSYHYPSHKWLHQYATQHPQSYEAAFKATMTISLQRNRNPFGRIAVVSCVGNAVLAFGIWRRLGPDMHLLNMLRVNAIIDHHFGGEYCTRAAQTVVSLQSPGTDTR